MPEEESGRGLSPAERIESLVAAAAVPGADGLAIAAELATLSRELAAPDPPNALTAHRAAIDVLRAYTPPTAVRVLYLLRLAEYLHTLSARWLAVGAVDSAVEAMREALPAYERAAVIDGADILTISDQLTLLGKQLVVAGVTDDAVAAQRLAIGALRSYVPPAGLALDRQTRLAEALHNLSSRLVSAGKVDDAATAAGEAVTEYGQTMTELRRARSLAANDLVELSRGYARAGQAEHAALAQRAAAYVVAPTGADPAATPGAPGEVTAALTRAATLRARDQPVRANLAALGQELSAVGVGWVAQHAAIVEAASTSDGRFCGVDDDVSATGIGPMTWGAVLGHWPSGNIRVSIDTSACVYRPTSVDPTAVGVILGAFGQWQRAAADVANGFFRFTFVTDPAIADVRVAFTLDSGGTPNKFGVPGDVLAAARPSPGAKLLFDAAEVWLPNSLLSVALHEIGHVLGLRHSNTPSALMFPFANGATTVDEEARLSLSQAFGWTDQAMLADRATVDRPRLCVTTRSTFTHSSPTVHMFWRGSPDPGIYHAVMAGPDQWGPQETLQGAAMFSPAVAVVDLPGASTPSTTPLIVWKGGGADERMFFSRLLLGGWTPQRPINGFGTSAAPALAHVVEAAVPFRAQVMMAWKGAVDDKRVWTSVWDGGDGWLPQAAIPGAFTSGAPEIVAYRNRLFCFYKGVDDDNTVWFTSTDPFAANPFWTAPTQVTYRNFDVSSMPPRIAVATSGTVSATVRGDHLLLCWKGSRDDRTIYTSLFDGVAFSGQARVRGVATTVGPGATTFSERVGAPDEVVHRTVMAWKGTETNNIFWSRLGPPPAG